jgi:Na+/proline symporter
LLQARVKQGTTEVFTTGGRTQGKWRIGWSFFAAAMGGWVITAPANFAVWGGWIAMMMYAIATGEKTRAAPDPATAWKAMQFNSIRSNI